MPTGYPTPQDKRDAIRILAEAGKSTREIAKALGMCQDTVWFVGKVKMGLEFHGKHGGHNRKVPA